MHGRCLHNNARPVHGAMAALFETTCHAAKAGYTQITRHHRLAIHFGGAVEARFWFPLDTGICGLLSTASSRILLNGSPGDTLWNRLGLGQGDPLLPMIFIFLWTFFITCFSRQRISELCLRLSASTHRYVATALPHCGRCYDLLETLGA